ncbi:hypothetical protein ACFSQE_12155 [Vogesella fluminis]|uniref:hypothetical protein n=1 Tax=Vogesella fluminis TaxID=1069161 RepID=UPI0036377F8A
MVPGSLVIPDNIVDYSWGRKHTFFEGRTSRWCTSISPGRLMASCGPVCCKPAARPA